MKTYFRLLAFAKPIEKYAIPYILCTIITVFFGTLNLTLLIPLMSTLFQREDAGISSRPDSWFDLTDTFKYFTYEMQTKFGEYGALQRVLLVVVISVFISNLFRYLSQRVMENLRIHTLLNLRKAVFDNVMNLHVGFFSSQRKGDIISKIASDVQVVQYSVTATLQVVFKEPLTLLFYLVTLFAISVKLTLFSILVVPVSAFVISLIVRRLKQQAVLGQQVYGRMISYLDEALSGIKVIKAFNATEYIKNRFHNENVYYSKIGRRMARRQQMASPVSELLGILMVAMIVLYAGKLVLAGEGELDAASFVGYIAIFSQLMRPAKAITDSFSNIHSGLAAGERVLELIDEKPEITDAPHAKEIDGFNKGIKLVNVSFSYSDRQVLTDINFEVPKGQTVALVGPSGGGKSTLMDLIPRFIEVEKGEILIDDTNIKEISTYSLRNQMGMVSQESILFNDTIFNNIAFGAEGISEADVINAAKIANAHHFILETAHGYQTNIGDRGIKLSGGQRQRICIARAVLRNPPILLLDEATSALDTESEKLVQESLNSLMKNRTTLVIAHRLSTIRSADNIIVLESGRVVEQGNHEQLMQKETGLYKKLVNMQQFETD
ncbi:ABC transporter ATP-binding protein [Olivibacter sitiensis]|uniref:ABC transporter ATP-binding protein n=1 Tax=Olivibacter sitiensis TaxID=376470 RepID=UPI000426E671|nr:ABC transporter ATP-binding protein [Olivibacter sitiensis]